MTELVNPKALGHATSFWGTGTPPMEDMHRHIRQVQTRTFRHKRAFALCALETRQHQRNSSRTASPTSHKTQAMRTIHHLSEKHRSTNTNNKQAASSYELPPQRQLIIFRQPNLYDLLGTRIDYILQLVNMRIHHVRQRAGQSWVSRK